MNPRGNITWTEFWNRYCRRNVANLLYSGGIVVVLCAFVFLLYHVANNDPIEQKRAIQAALLERDSSDERKLIAQAMLTADSKFAPDDSTRAYLEEALRTGQVQPVTGKLVTWQNDFLGDWITTLVPGIIMLFIMLVLTNLAEASMQRRERILDLPWHKPWTWLFVLLTLVPGVLIYPFSIAGVIKDRRARPRSRLELVNEEALCARVRREHYFRHHPEDAQRAYRTARIGDRRRELEQRRDDHRRRLSDLSSTIQSLAERLRHLQKQKGETAAQLTQTEQDLGNLVEDQPEAAQINAEFDRLTKLPGVMGVGASGDQVNVLVRIILEHGREGYFQGDWEISFSPDQGLKMNCLKSGVKKGWRYGKHPDYRDHGYGFCMGSRQDEILSFARNRNYLEAVELLINSMMTVNPQDEYLVPEAFRRVNEQ